MKRKLLLTSMLLAITGLITHAQDLDIKPSQQAQGILESKNGMVDHATGLFHYKVPLYEIKSGNFTLPISLNYVAKGVKADDKPGLVGYNWSLNTGGVITRTIRGGIADEDWIGMSRKPLSVVPTTDEIEAVNKRERDGETDIYTVYLNGKNINFRVIHDILNTVRIVEPLEKTNVKITSEYQNGIDFWIVIDEEGNKYTFKQKEWTSNINREGITDNGIDNKDYVSAWYLNKIEPINGSEIIFSYINEVRSRGMQDSISSIKNYNLNKVIYNYGRPMKEYGNFNRYKNEFDLCISEARAFINMANVQIQVNNYVELYVNGHVMQNPFITSSVVKTNFSVLGMLSDLSGISAASIEISNALDNLIRLYSGHASTNIQIGVSLLREAKRLSVLMVAETVSIDERVVYMGESFEIRSPLLSKIECKSKVINFSYNTDTNGRYKLDEVNLYNNRNRIKGIKLYNNDNLRQISYLDYNRKEYDKINLHYYDELGINVEKDLWGYYKDTLKTSSQINFPPHGNSVDLDNTKYRTLSDIITKGGNKITLEYESNTIREWQNGQINDYGGLRIGRITINRSDAENSDVINYRYPGGGQSVYADYSNRESISYPNYGFSDQLIFSEAIYGGNAYISFGNNSLYYLNVEEEFVGKGKNKYSFYLPTTSDMYYKFPYLLCGLPLSKKIYDENDHLKSIIKFNYHTNETLSGSVNNNSGEPAICAPTKKIPQIKANRYYINEAKMEKDYKSQGTFNVGNGTYISPYYLYEYNLKPRAKPHLYESQVYNIFYGGCVLLKEKIEYFFEENSSEQSSNNYRKEEYYYDNFENSTLPTRIITTKSDGSQEIEVIKRVTEMSNSVAPIINEMKSKNIYNPIIKTQKLIKKHSTDNYRLIKEDVYEYCKNGDNIQLEKISSYNPTEHVSVTVQNPMIDNRLYEQPNYSIEKTFNYQSYLPSYITTLSEKISTKYDPLSDEITLTSKDTKEHSTLVADKFNRSALEYADNYLNFLAAISEFFEDTNKLFYVVSLPNFKEDELMQFTRTMEDILRGRNTLSFEEFKSRTAVIRNLVNAYLAGIENIVPFQRISERCLMNLLQGIEEISADITGSKYQHMNVLASNYSASDPVGFSINDVNSNKYRVFLLNNSQWGGSIQYQISHSTGKYSGSSSFTGSNKWQLSIIDIDLDNFTNVESLTILHPLGSSIAYMAIVPFDTEFEATSYNADGTVFCKFNQNGQLERYEYDAAGRVVKVYDNDNNVLKEFKYNVVL